MLIETKFKLGDKVTSYAGEAALTGVVVAIQTSLTQTDFTVVYLVQTEKYKNPVATLETHMTLCPPI